MPSPDERAGTIVVIVVVVCGPCVGGCPPRMRVPGPSLSCVVVVCVVSGVSTYVARYSLISPTSLSGRRALALVSSSSVTWLLLTVDWISKKQTTIETSEFGAEFVAMKNGVEKLRGLQYASHDGLPLVQGFIHMP